MKDISDQPVGINDSVFSRLRDSDSQVCTQIDSKKELSDLII